MRQTLESHSATEDVAVRGAYVRVLVGQLSNLSAVRAETIRATLREMDDDEGHFGRFEEAREGIRETLSHLDGLSAGVGPRDVYQHDSAHVGRLVQELAGKLHSYDAYEAGELVPFMRERLGTERMAELGERAERTSRRGPSHSHAGLPPADERSTVGKFLTTLADRIDDRPTHAEQTLEGEGEEGP